MVRFLQSLAVSDVACADALFGSSDSKILHTGTACTCGTSGLDAASLSRFAGVPENRAFGRRCAGAGSF